jgi:hypothetical protein
MQAQLRRYRIRDDQLAQFTTEWREVVVPLRARFGFRARGWAAPDSGEFVWVLEHEGDREGFEQADAAYYASDARKAVRPDPARLVEEAHHTWLEPVP